ncbi:MAG: HEAT repeat domain-containing protein [Actinomycetota bacterium]|nr:MAG: HEAT repeat domain-containing protein [Actinomycetota bacterium]
MRFILIVSVLALSASILLMIIATVILRFARTRIEARSLANRAELRTLLVKFLSEDLNPGELRLLKTSGSAELEELSETMLAKVKGRAKDILVSFLESRGTVEQAIRRTTQRGYLGRCRAAAFLGHIGSAEAREPLEAMLRDRRRDVRITAARSLGYLGDPKSIPALLTGLDYHRRLLPFGTVLVALMRIGSSGQDLVGVGLRSGGERQRAVAAEFLGLTGAIRFTTELVDLLVNDRSLDVRIRSARALGRIGSPSTITPLIGCLDKNNATGLRTVSCAALAAIGGGQVVSEICQLIEEDDYLISSAAAKAVSQMGPLGTECLDQIAKANSAGSPYAKEVLARVAARVVDKTQNQSEI